MLKKLSKSRKKKQALKPTTSHTKLPKQPQRQQIEIKERKISSKKNHHTSTLSLLSNNCNHNASQCSLAEEGKAGGRGKGKTRNRESSVSLIGGKESLVKDKQKQKSKNAKDGKEGKDAKDGKKSKKNSSLNQNSRSKKTILKISPIKIDKSDKTTKALKYNPSKKSRLHNQQQLYERINLCLYQSKTNSEINFSNNSSVRDHANVPNHNRNTSINDSMGMGLGNVNQSKNLHRKTLTIDCSDQLILSQYFSNSRIKNSEKKRVEAAIRIQKVFRGYLTRKMLQQYIEKQEERLQELERMIRNSSSRQSVNQQSSRQSQSQQQPKQQPLPNSNPLNSSPEYYPQQQQIDFSLKQIKKQQFLPINHEALQQESSIYPQHNEHDSISRYLPFNDHGNNNSIDQLRDQSEIFQDYHQGIMEEEHINVNVNGRGRGGESQRLENWGIEMEEKEGKGGLKNREISQEYFKYTPASSYAPKQKNEEPIPTDFSQKRVEEFESAMYEGRSKQLFQQKSIASEVSQPEQDDKSQHLVGFPKRVLPPPSERITRNIKKQEDVNRKQIVVLKRQEKQKWNKIIEMLSYQIVQAKSKNEENEKFMHMILDFSKKNKEQLEQSCSSIAIQNKNESADKNQQQTELIMNQNSHLKKQMAFEQESRQIKQQKKLEKNMDMPLLQMKKYTNLNISLYNCHIPKPQNNISLFQKTQQLKNFYKKNYAAYPIQQMIQIREKALEKRQKQMVNKLNQDLYSENLTHEQFIVRLSEMQEKFQNERQLINKAKMEIFMGYRATHKLMQDSVRDAWYLGFKIPFSQSLKDFKGTNHNNLWVKELIVDQLRQYSSSHNSHPSQPPNPPAIDQSQLSCHESSPGRIQRERTSQMKKHDLSISLPNEDSSFTVKPSSEVSQQSLFSDEISYNEGEVEIRGLEECQGKGEFIYEGDLSQDESQDEKEAAQRKNQTKGFRRVDPQKLLLKKNSPQTFNQGPLLLDPQQQEEIDKQVLQKISLNQRKRPTNDPNIIPTPNMNINMSQLRRYEMTPRNNNNPNTNTSNNNRQFRTQYPAMQPKSQIYKLEMESESDEDEIIFNEDMDPSIKEITEEQVLGLIWEAAGEMYGTAGIKTKLVKNRSRAPASILAGERASFVTILVGEVPQFEAMVARVNQKMMASRMELLKFMRVTFQEESEEQLEKENADGDGDISRSESKESDGFEQIGKFQHILSSDVCLSAISKFLQKEQEKQQIKMVENEEQIIQKRVKQALSTKVPSQCIQKVIERQKVNAYNQIQKIDLRKQIMKVQFHCIFDSLNEILMKKRLKTIGYSGIGLNQLTLVTKGQSFRQIHSKQKFQQIFSESLRQLTQLISCQKSSSDKLLMQNYEKLCENDSQWICYTDQALSFALEFVYMLEDEIFFQETAQIFRKFRGY